MKFSPSELVMVGKCIYNGKSAMVGAVSRITIEGNRIHVLDSHYERQSVDNHDCYGRSKAEHSPIGYRTHTESYQR